jgi:translocation and assembly module TamB
LTPQLPLAKLNGRVQGTTADLALSDLLVDFGAAGKLSGRGRLRGSRLDLTLLTQRLNLQSVHGKLHATELAGIMRANASQSNQDFSLSLAQKDGRMDVDGTLRNGELTVKHVRATAAGGSLVAHGKLGLRGAKPLAFTGTLNNRPRASENMPKRINSRCR